MMLCAHHEVLSLVHDKVKKMLQKEHVGYVLVTAKKTGNPNKLEVELSYEGETALASYLVDGAQDALDAIFESEVEECGVNDARSV